MLKATRRCKGPRRCACAEIMDEVMQDCAVEAELRGSSIELKGRAGGEVLGNRELLRRAVENVVRNGIRYAPDKSAVHILVEESGRDVKIAVRDYGPGVPEDALNRIFDPFFRVEEARNTNGGGSGLGLSIAKRAVELHHGSIVAHNATPGLRVEITIPLVTRNATV